MNVTPGVPLLGIFGGCPALYDVATGNPIVVYTPTQWASPARQWSKAVRDAVGIKREIERENRNAKAGNVSGQAGSGM